MKLLAYVIEGHSLDIRPAPVERAWMNTTRERFAYRCLPLDIANAHGWEILCSSAFTAVWTGEPDLNAIAIKTEGGGTPPAVSHFGNGILTFHVPCVFRTEPGYDLLIQGPMNQPKDGLSPLSGIIETDWAPYGFTMNWLFTSPEVDVQFDKGEPFCHLFPIRHGEIEAFEPEIRPLADDPELQQQHEAWTKSRQAFNAELKQPGSPARSERWQKFYHRGHTPKGSSPALDHRTHIRIRPFAIPPVTKG